MKTVIRSGLVAAVVLCLAVTAHAQNRLSNTPQSDAVLNANSAGFISTPNGGDAITDGSFEGGSPNAAWNEASTNFGSPICDVIFCGTGAGTAFPNTGAFWVWFGGAGPALETGSVSQDVTFPNGAANLTFFFGATVCAHPADFTELLVDGNQEWVLFGDDPTCDVLAYGEYNIDLSAYADGGVHTIEFRSETGQGGSSTNHLLDDVSLLAEEVPDLARFLVSKNFDDNNPGEVEITLSCNTGLPLEQTTTISPSNPKNLVIGDFEQGSLNCTVTEVPVDGYTASYNDGSVSADNCAWEALTGGQYACAITNSLDESTVEVSKVWIDEKPAFNPINYAEAEWECSPVAFCRGRECSDGGTLEFLGNPGDDSFSVFPDWDGGTTCDITEVSIADGGVEVDDSECQGILLFPGDTASCTIYNTRLYAGIPTLSQYGLAVLALLMLGMGMVGFRRFV